MDEVVSTLVQGINQMFFTLVVCSLYAAIQLTFSVGMLVLNNTD